MIDTGVELIVVIGLLVYREQVVTRSREIRQRDSSEQRHRGWIERGSNRPTRERQARCSVQDRSAAKDSGTLGSRRNAEYMRQRLPNPYAVVVDKKERLVLYNWTSQRRAELVFLEGRSGLIGERKEVLGVEDVISQKLVQCAVKTAGARLRYHIDHTARFASELGAVICLDDVEFLNRVRR